MGAYLLGFLATLLSWLALGGSVFSAVLKTSDRDKLSESLRSRRRTWRVLALAFRNHVPDVRHQHVTAESREQCLLAVLAAAWT
jgi:hypothetical protein